VDEDLEQLISWLRHPMTTQFMEAAADLFDSPLFWHAAKTVADEMCGRLDEQREAGRAWRQF
jgi:hypothetical protein